MSVVRIIYKNSVVGCWGGRSFGSLSLLVLEGRWDGKTASDRYPSISVTLGKWSVRDPAVYSWNADGIAFVISNVWVLDGAACQWVNSEEDRALSMKDRFNCLSLEFRPVCLCPLSKSSWPTVRHQWQSAALVVSLGECSVISKH